MTHFYVTTGTSLSIESRCWLVDDESTRPDGFTKNDRDTDSLFNLLNDGDPDVVEEVIKVIDDARRRSSRFKTGHIACELADSLNAKRLEQKASELAEAYFDVSCWHRDKRRTLSAELSTLLTMSNLGMFEAQDRMTLIGGPTNRAEVAMTQAVLRQMAGKEYFNVPADSINAYYQDKLDPLNHDDFFDALTNLWQKVNPPEELKREFVVTGGYKGVGIGLALRVTGENTAFHYLHDEAEGIEEKGFGLVTMYVENGEYVKTPG